MKETKAKKSTYLRNFIIAVALSAAILAAGALWVLLSWRSALNITLTDLAGDPAALRGFTMRGQSYFDTAHTYWDLHDGYLDTSFALDPDESDDRYHYSAWGASHFSATLKKSVFPCTVQDLEPCWWRESSCLSFGTAHPSAASPARAACSIAGRTRTRPRQRMPCFASSTSPRKRWSI